MDFDRHAGEYERRVSEALEFTGLRQSVFLEAKARAALSLAARRLGGDEGLRVLEVGCGIGSMLRLLVGRGRRLVGTDPSLAALGRAGRECAGAAFVRFDGGTLPFPDDRFDLVMAVSVLHHVDPAARPRLTGEMARVTRDGGLVVVFEHNPFNPLTRRVVARCELDRDAVLLRSGETVSLLRAAGAGEIERRFILFVPWSGRPWDALQRLLARLPLGAQYLVAGRRRGGGAADRAS